MDSTKVGDAADGTTKVSADAEGSSGADGGGGDGGGPAVSMWARRFTFGASDEFVIHIEEDFAGESGLGGTV